MIQWLISRVAVIYVVVLLFCLTCVDLNMLQMRIKLRYLNDSIPDFSDMIVFSKDRNAKNDINWTPYEKYFELILKYIPDDVLTKQLLGFVDYYAGHEQEAANLFKDSVQISGRTLFWPNYDLGIIYYKKGMWPQAANYFLKAVQSNPQLTMLLIKDSMVYKQISVNPYFKYSFDNEMQDARARVYIFLLSSLYHMGQFDKMILVANLALADQGVPYKDAIYYYAGLAFYEMRQMNKAYLLFQESLKIEKDNPDVYYYIATIFQKAGQLEQARALIQVSYALHQKNDPRFPYDAQTKLRFF